MHKYLILVQDSRLYRNEENGAVDRATQRVRPSSLTNRLHRRPEGGISVWGPDERAVYKLCRRLDGRAIARGADRVEWRGRAGRAGTDTSR